MYALQWHSLTFDIVFRNSQDESQVEKEESQTLEAQEEEDESSQVRTVFNIHV